MATYIELHNLRGSSSLSPLRQRINVAIAIKANTLSKSSPTAAQGAWAKSALANPEASQEIVLNYILAEYNTATTAVIVAATDEQVQTAVNAAVSILLEV